jgi:hypothetical protein
VALILANIRCCDKRPSLGCWISLSARVVICTQKSGLKFNAALESEYAHILCWNVSLFWNMGVVRWKSSLPLFFNPVVLIASLICLKFDRRHEVSFQFFFIFYNKNLESNKNSGVFFKLASHISLIHVSGNPERKITMISVMS